MTNQISSARNISVEELNTIADELLIRSAIDAKQYQLVDDLLYEDEVLAALKMKVGIEEDETLKTIALKKLNKVKDSKIEGSKLKINSKNRIAVIFAEGEIVSGESRDGVMGSETVANAIKDARLDSKIKAIVLRVNSPGGSALASDVMWREVMLAKAEKPVIV